MKTGARIAWDTYESPLGPLTIHASRRGVTGLYFPGSAAPLDDDARDPGVLADAREQLEEYFAGDRRVFELALDLSGTPFQRRVWAELQTIPYGTTVTYGQLAERVGRADIVRGVAAAVGQTPVPIVVPCHRVLAAGGALTGYLGGLHRKRALLDHERRTTDAGDPAPLWSIRQLALL